jgi:hypothetical protein
MLQSTPYSRQNQLDRLNLKKFTQQLTNISITDAGLTNWEAKSLVEVVTELMEVNNLTTNQGQTVYSCVAITEPAGKPIKECSMISVPLTIWDPEDQNALPYNKKDSSILIRRRRIMRISEEAREHDGLLSQEDLAYLLMSDVRTIRRDIAALKKEGIVVPTRGTVKDIGPGVTHKELAIRHWLNGKEPTEIATQIKHSLKATERYLEKFKRVIYLHEERKFNTYDIARTIGISIAATKVYLSLLEEFRKEPFFQTRIDEIKIVGKRYYLAEGEKKSFH